MTYHIGLGLIRHITTGLAGFLGHMEEAMVTMGEGGVQQDAQDGADRIGVVTQDHMVVQDVVHTEDSAEHVADLEVAVEAEEVEDKMCSK